MNIIKRLDLLEIGGNCNWQFLVVFENKRHVNLYCYNNIFTEQRKNNGNHKDCFHLWHNLIFLNFPLSFTPLEFKN